MSPKKYCGEIDYGGHSYPVKWDEDTKLVWVENKNGTLKNIGERQAKSIEEALDCAKEMMEDLEP